MPQLSQETITVIIGIAALFLAFFPTVRTVSKDRQAATIERTESNMLQKQILASINDIKGEMSAVKAQQSNDSKRMDGAIERIVILEQSNKSMHRRMDEHIQQLHN